jgi:hypothetical protein
MQMTFKNLRLKLLVSLLIATLASTSFGAGAPPSNDIGPVPWEYNPGPDPRTPSGRALVDLYAELPEYMEISEALMERQKFRYIFGMMLTRTYFEKNDVKVLFIGQDATHIAEAAKQPGTSGFGARVQSIGNYFGVDQSVSTTNAFLSTINGQYGAYDHPIVEIGKNGKATVRKLPYVDNELWMLANGRDSEILLKREQFWEWMIKNNPDSLDLLIMFGGAARDSWAEFLIGRGAKVGTRLDAERLKTIQVPETKLVYAGGNNEFAVPIDKNGKDIYEVLLGEKLNYSKPGVQEAAIKALEEAGQRGIDMMVFTGGGVNGSGVMNPAQLGGYDLDEVYINGKRTNSLKGLVLSDGYVVEKHIGFTMSAHPSALSKMKPSDASAALKRSFARLSDLKEDGWSVKPDLDDAGKPMINEWDAGKDYKYGRADIRPGYFEFGAPDDRRVSRADASRLDPQTIVAGSRDRVSFDKELIEKAKNATPSEAKNPNDLWSVRPRQKETRYIFDRGPGKETAKILMSNLDRDVIFEPKPGMKVVDKRGIDITFETHGIDAYYTKTHPGTGFFGLHRGSFENSKALILADPHGIDDWNTSRALTGARGQYLNGLMQDLGFGEDYLVLKTVPVGMDGATAAEWEVVRQRTEKYREAAIKRALENPKIEIIFTDGDIAKSEMERVLDKLEVRGKTVVNIRRSGMDPRSGIIEAGHDAQSLLKKPAKDVIKGKMADLPRSHLPWWARTWEGTSGDLVIDATGKARGGVRALVTPNWVARQKVIPSKSVTKSIGAIESLLEKAGIRIASEDVRSFLKRKSIQSGNFTFIEKERQKRFGLSGSKPSNIADQKCLDLLRATNALELGL